MTSWKVRDEYSTTAECSRMYRTHE